MNTNNTAKATADVAFLYPYRIKGMTCLNNRELANALGKKWDEGKRHLYRGLLSGFFKNFDPEIAGICMDAEEVKDRPNTRKTENRVYFDVIYKIDPNCSRLYWCGEAWDSLEDFGNKLLDDMRMYYGFRKGFAMTWAVDISAEKTISIQMRYESMIKEMIKQHIVSTYAMLRKADKKTVQSIKTIESAIIRLKTDSYGFQEGGEEELLYNMAYLLGGDKRLQVKKNYICGFDDTNDYYPKKWKYNSVNALLDDVDSYLTRFPKRSELLCEWLSFHNAQFIGWLFSKGVDISFKTNHIIFTRARDYCKDYYYHNEGEHYFYNKSEIASDIDGINLFSIMYILILAGVIMPEYSYTSEEAKFIKWHYQVDDIVRSIKQNY